VLLAASLTVLTGLLTQPALAQDIRAWQGMQEGMLIEAADGNLQGAVSWYEGLVDGAAQDDPAVSEIYYWLGRARYVQGEAEGARKALKLAEEDPDNADRARALRAQIDGLDLQVRSLPVTHTFDTGTSHWVHSWQYQGRGAIDIGRPTPEDDPAMAWATAVAELQDDRIQMSFAPGETPRTFTLQLRSRVFPAWVLLGAEDDRGNYYRMSTAVEVSTDGWVTVTARPKDFQPEDAGWGAGDPWPQTVRTLYLFDVTARLSSDRGPNTIYVDDVTVR